MLFRGHVTPISTTFPLTVLAGLFMDQYVLDWIFFHALDLISLQHYLWLWDVFEGFLEPVLVSELSQSKKLNSDMVLHLLNEFELFSFLFWHKVSIWGKILSFEFPLPFLMYLCFNFNQEDNWKFWVLLWSPLYIYLSCGEHQ